jgi:predicted small secreted protein
MRAFIIMAVAAAGLWLAGCNTVEGVGRDFQAMGAAVSGSAQDVKR